MQTRKNTVIVGIPENAIRPWPVGCPYVQVSISIYQMTAVSKTDMDIEDDELDTDRYDAIELGWLKGKLFASAKSMKNKWQSMVSPDAVGVINPYTVLPWLTDKATLVISDFNVSSNYDEVMNQLPTICAQLYQVYPNRIILLKSPTDPAKKD